MKVKVLNTGETLYDAVKDSEGDYCPMLELNDSRLGGFMFYDNYEMKEQGLEYLIGKKKVFPFSNLELVDDENE